MAEPYRVCMLGALRAQVGDREIARFRTQKCAALLAYLAHSPPDPDPREAVCELQWPRCSPRSRRDNLNTAVLSLRRQLEPPGVARGAVLRSDRQSVQLVPEALGTDATDLEAALRASARPASSPGRVHHLHRAQGVSDVPKAMQASLRSTYPGAAVAVFR